MSKRRSDWMASIRKDELVTFSLEYLIKNGHYTQPFRGLQKPKKESEILLELINEMEASAEGKLAIKALQDAVRQERAKRLRESKNRVIKRFTLTSGACSKLEQVSSSTGKTQSAIVEGLILEEVALQKEESLYLKAQRKKLKQRTDAQKKVEEGIEAREIDLKTRLDEVLRSESKLSAQVDRVAVFEKLTRMVRGLEEENIGVQLQFESGGSTAEAVNFESDTAEGLALESLQKLFSRALESTVPDVRRTHDPSPEAE